MKLQTAFSGKTLVVVLELLHCLSRILILVLKFRRTQCIETEKDISQKKCTLASRDLDEKIKKLLQAMTQKLGFILTKDEVLIDTKNNFAIAGLLIREILTPDEKQLKQVRICILNLKSFYFIVSLYFSQLLKHLEISAKSNLQK